jgi:hypothetical protein
MSQFNTSTNHPLIPNSQEYLVYKKIISIHSEDRDIIKYPSASDFEIELPQDYLNVRSACLSSWTFPANYSTFSLQNRNITMSFQLTPCNPGTLRVSDPLQNAIFNALYKKISTDYFIIIESGFYNPDQMVTELTNRFNQAVTNYIISSIDATYLDSFLQQGGYNDFVVVYNNVSQKIWFGNKSSEFTLTYNESVNEEFYSSTIYCRQQRVPSFTNWGLPFFVGLTRCPETAIAANGTAPRFYYGDVKPGDSGFWLPTNPNLPGCDVYFLECPQKINLMGPSYFYIDIDLLNNIDETYPFNVSGFTNTTNETNGKVNSAFAKIAIPTTPLSQWFETEGSESYKIFDPPAERIRRLKIKLRYHDGSPVNFDTFPFSFSLQFTLFNAQKKLGYNLTLI